MPDVSLLMMLGVSAVLTTLGWALHRRWGEEPNALLSIGYTLCFVVAGIACIVPYAAGGTVNHQGPVLIRLSLALIFFVPPGYFMGQFVAGLLAGRAVDALYGSTVLTVPTSRYGKAFALAKQNASIAAAREFRAYFDANPDVPDPLFHAARTLEDAKYHREAAQHYRDILRAFEKKPPIWAEAAHRLAELYAFKMNKKPEARALLRKVIATTRNVELRRRATDKLQHIPD